MNSCGTHIVPCTNISTLWYVSGFFTIRLIFHNSVLLFATIKFVLCSFSGPRPVHMGSGKIVPRVEIQQPPNDPHRVHLLVLQQEINTSIASQRGTRSSFHGLDVELITRTQERGIYKRGSDHLPWLCGGAVNRLLPLPVLAQTCYHNFVLSRLSGRLHPNQEIFHLFSSQFSIHSPEYVPSVRTMEAATNA